MEVDDEFNRLIRSDGWSFHIPIVCDFVGRSTIQSLVRSISLEPALVQRKFPLHRIAEIRNPNTVREDFSSTERDFVQKASVVKSHADPTVHRK